VFACWQVAHVAVVDDRRSPCAWLQVPWNECSEDKWELKMPETPGDLAPAGQVRHKACSVWYLQSGGLFSQCTLAYISPQRLVSLRSRRGQVFDAFGYGLAFPKATGAGGDGSGAGQTGSVRLCICPSCLCARLPLCLSACMYRTPQRDPFGLVADYMAFNQIIAYLREQGAIDTVEDKYIARSPACAAADAALQLTIDNMLGRC
jgi:hypothetical protein